MTLTITSTHSLPTYAQLTRPLPLWNPKAWYYGAFCLALRTVGQLSAGVRLGYRYGFDSGVMLEYVYRNQPHGITPLGTLIDRLYLNSQGWQGIRDRAQLLETTLETVLSSHVDAGRPCRLLDVACGGGRYDLEVLQKFSSQGINATLRDYKPENVAQARQLAQEWGINACIEQGDAFSDADLNQVHPRPNVIVVSGLHEILPDNDLIERHFHQLYRIMEAPGTLIFTIQPHHPQLELIARTLPAHTGRPWTMRLRPWDLARQWALAAGFVNPQVKMERHGIFGVVTMEKPDRPSTATGC